MGALRGRFRNDVAGGASAVGDELSYLQDRIAAEATLETATQRRSLMRHARLVDYEPRPATSGTTTIQCNVSATALPAGLRIRATTPDGRPVPFEIGTGLTDATRSVVSPLWNDGIQPYWFDRQPAVPAARLARDVGAGHRLRLQQRVEHY